MQCSESFYRKEIEVGMKLQSTRTTTEREKMVELLRQLNELGVEGDKVFENNISDEEDGDELTTRLKGLDTLLQLMNCWSALQRKNRMHFVQHF